MTDTDTESIGDISAFGLDGYRRVMPYLCKYDDGREEYRYSILDDKGDCIIALSEKDVRILSEAYFNYHTWHQ